MRREEGVWASVQVAHGELDAGVDNVDVHVVGGDVTGTDVALASEWRDGDGVIVQDGDVVAEASVDIALKQDKEHTTSEREWHNNLHLSHQRLTCLPSPLIENDLENGTKKKSQVLLYVIFK